MSKYRMFGARKKAPAGPAPKPIRIERKIVHGRLVDVKIYAEVVLTGPSLDGLYDANTVRPRKPGRPARLA